MNTQSKLSVNRNHQDLDWYHVTALSNFAKGYDKYKNQYSKEAIPQSTFPGQFFLLKKEELPIGLKKAQRLVDKLNLPNDKLIVLCTRLPNSMLSNDHASGVAQYVAQNYIDLSTLYFIEDNERLMPVRVEDAMALSLDALGQTLQPWTSLKPRSVSVLPISMACQASCKFCFSKASVSSDFKGKITNWDRLNHVLVEAKKAGAERAVITGGGEPTLLEQAHMQTLIQQCARNFSKVVLISNAHTLFKMGDKERLATLLKWTSAGLSILAISRHHHNEHKNTEIMGLETGTQSVAKTVRDNNTAFDGLTIRFICVLQKEGVSTVADVENYLSWAIRQGVRQINFKELYVSTSNESAYSGLEANDYSAEHQVSLSVINDFIEKHQWTKIATLPWGAPIYKGLLNGEEMQIAAYTEPSVFWERTNGIARSWNLMSDGRALASLEDLKSDVLKDVIK